jgi:hypothetical protein
MGGHPRSQTPELSREEELIEFGGQYGEPRAASLLAPLQRELNLLFESFDLTFFFPNVKKISIIFRVSGKIRDFSGEGPDRPEAVNGGKELSIDLVIPAVRWRGAERSTLKRYLAGGIKDASDVLANFVGSKDAGLDVSGFLSAVEARLAQFG